MGFWKNPKNYRCLKKIGVSLRGGQVCMQNLSFHIRLEVWMAWVCEEKVDQMTKSHDSGETAKGVLVTFLIKNIQALVACVRL